MKASHDKHYLDPKFAGAIAHFTSNKDVDTAIVFVHGFSGDPVSTWDEFPIWMDNGRYVAQWEKSDAYFFDYKDITSSIDDSSDDLSDFLGAIYPKPLPWIQTLISQVRGLSVTYSDLILVGHSEGGVVIRACLAGLGKKMHQTGTESPILNARVALFAPALFGFLPTSWLGLIAQIFPIKQLLNFAIAGSRAASELEDGVVLEQVRRDTEKLYQLFPDHAAFVAHVVFGRDEDTVRKERYFQDPKHRAQKGKNHKTICKPDVGYQEPLRFVKGNE